MARQSPRRSLATLPLPAAAVDVIEILDLFAGRFDNVEVRSVLIDKKPALDLIGRSKQPDEVEDDETGGELRSPGTVDGGE